MKKKEKTVIVVFTIILFVLVCGITVSFGIKKQNKTVDSIITTETTKITKAENEATTSNNLSKNDTSINLNNYISVSFHGLNTRGYASISFEKEKFLLENAKTISFNQTNLNTFIDLYGNDDKSAAYRLCRFFSPQITENTNLSNGDTIKIVWDVDEDKIKTYFNCNLTFAPTTFYVKGLKEANITTITLPNFKGLNYNDVKNDKSYQDLIVFVPTYVDSTEDIGTIVSQDIPAGTTISSIDGVRIVAIAISRGLTVPYIETMSREAAISTLSDAGFTNIKTIANNSDTTTFYEHMVYQIGYENPETGEFCPLPSNRILSSKTTILLYYYK